MDTAKMLAGTTNITTCLVLFQSILPTDIERPHIDPGGVTVRCENTKKLDLTY